jgi:hypothetical protein
MSAPSVTGGRGMPAAGLENFPQGFREGPDDTPGGRLMDPLYDITKLRIDGGRIAFKIRQQDGSFQDMSCPDTLDNRLLVQWMQIHDGVAGPARAA